VRTLLCGASGVALGAILFAGTAHAQDAQDPEAVEVEEIIVTGIRSSLRSAQAIKQDSDVFVDAISAEDIGALPDRSVTEALQRVPGVSISRLICARRAASPSAAVLPWARMAKKAAAPLPCLLSKKAPTLSAI